MIHVVWVRPVIHVMWVGPVINRTSRLMVDNLVVYYLVANDASIVSAIDVACIIIMMTAVATWAVRLCAYIIAMTAATLCKCGACAKHCDSDEAE